MSLKTKDFQLTHQNFIPKVSKKQLVLLCDQVTGPANFGSLLRLAEAFSVKKIITSEKFNLTPRLIKTARNTQKATPIEVSENLMKELEFYKKEGFNIIALEISKQSVPIHKFKFTDDKYALIIGSESHGVNSELLSLADQVLHIEMFGNNSSMNVTHAAAIALYEMRRNE